jgi:hypothetical protein
MTEQSSLVCTVGEHSKLIVRSRLAILFSVVQCYPPYFYENLRLSISKRKVF